MLTIPDVQKRSDGFPPLRVNKVGVRNIVAPFTFVWDGTETPVIGNFSMYCNLSPTSKGINMSRMARTLFQILRDRSLENLQDLCFKLSFAHETDHIYARCHFVLPYRAHTPISKMETDEYVPVLLETIYEKRETTNYVQITYTGMSLCPCSREMSLLEHNLTDDERHALETARLPQSLQNKLRLVGFGAHNQKSIVEIKVDLSSTSNPPIRELLYVAERAVSSPVFSILRREDEKYLTESSYAGISVDGAGGLINIENTGAKFVEDIARQAADTLNKEYLDKKINDYVIVVNNQESIHSHDIAATAIISAGRGLR